VVLTVKPNGVGGTLQEWLDRGYVHVKFTQTRGGTELGYALDRQQTDLSLANLESNSGSLRLVGDLILNYAKVRCTAVVDLPSLDGVGWLEPIE
jgi:hypothetical protein